MNKRREGKLRDIILHLKSGKAPETHPLNKPFAHSGVNRDVYRLGDYIVKSVGFYNDDRPPKTAFRKLGIKSPRQWFVTHTVSWTGLKRVKWIIQPYYGPPAGVLSGHKTEKLELSKKFHSSGYDLHAWNWTFLPDGKPVAFDW